jgi:ribosomal-protein-alanine N-acetyltransferase
MIDTEMYTITRMTAADVPEAYVIECVSFTDPWELATYYREIANPTSVYLVARLGDRIVGFGGIETGSGEGVIVTLGVAPDIRRRGVGRCVLKALLAEALLQHLGIVTLEVRVGDTAAQQLYREFGFRIIAHLQHFYPDNNEDAAVMALELMERS